MDFSTALQHFFVTYDLVVSGNHMAHPLPFFMQPVEQTRITYKTTYRRYVGWKRNASNEICFDDIQHVVWRATVETISYETFNPNHASCKWIIEECLCSNGIETWRTIGTLFECQDSHGFGDLVFQMTWISLGMHLIAALLKQEEIVHKESKSMKQVVSFAKKLNQTAATYITKSAYVEPTLSPSWGLFLWDDSSVNSFPNWCGLDFTVVNIGGPTNRDISYVSSKTFLQHGQELVGDAYNLEKCLEGITTAMKKAFVQEIFDSVESANPELQQERLLYVYQQRSHLVQMIVWNNSWVTKIIALFHLLKEFEEEKCVILPYVFGQAWSNLLIVTKELMSRKTLEKLDHEIKKTIPLAFVEWRSREKPSKEVRWPSIEQWVSKKQVSNKINKNLVIAKKCDGTIVSGEYDQVKKQLNGVVLNAIENKIFYNGEKVASHYLKSHSYTIALFKLLLDNLNTALDNKQLPVSSYSRSSNQMQWKILIPFQNYLKEIRWITLNIHCIGQLYKYMVKLENSNHDVWYIDYIKP